MSTAGGNSELMIHKTPLGKYNTNTWVALKNLPSLKRLRLHQIVIVENADVFSSRVLETNVPVTGQTETPRILKEANSRIGKARDDFSGVILRTIIYDDDFKIVEGLTQNAPEAHTDETAAAITGDGDSNCWGHARCLACTQSSIFGDR